MADPAVAIQRPARWDVPFGPDMTAESVRRVLRTKPFSDIDPAQFSPATPLNGIVQNDCRIVRHEPGDIIVREGDYGHSLFFIMEGSVRVALGKLPDAVLGRLTRRRKSVMQTLAQLWTNHRGREYRAVAGRLPTGSGGPDRGSSAGVFLQDVPAILDEYQTAEIGAGEFFGELSALARIPRSATVFAETECELLELRWQGFRDLRRRVTALRDHVDQIYRERSLESHLRATPIFNHLTPDELTQIADQTVFETYGDFDWHATYKTITQANPEQRLAHEPTIATEGHYSNGILLIRAGFARQSRRHGNGEQTLGYLGRGHVYGLEEIAKSPDGRATLPCMTTLRAIGYVDVLRVPTIAVEQFILPAMAASQIQATSPAIASADHRTSDPVLDTRLLEFFVENRHVNGTATMLIDLDRCTRCDDCVRACASTHDNNPRFVRHGPRIDHYMVANACMHCADPVCMIGCPTGAIHRDPHGGEVVINDLTCIGCATCANSCPYHNIRMVEVRDDHDRLVRDDQSQRPIMKATKCDLCSDQPGGPACQRACPHDALVRLDMTDQSIIAGWVDR